MTSPTPDINGDLDDTRNTELVRWTGDCDADGGGAYSLRAHVSIDLHTCTDGHTHYVLYAQTEMMVDTLDEALSVAGGMVQRYAEAGFQMQKVEL